MATKRAQHDAQCFISIGVKEVSSRKRIIEASSAPHCKLEAVHIDLSAPDMPALHVVDTLAAAVTSNKNILVSRSTVLDKIKIIAEVTVNAVDVIAKVNGDRKSVV